MLHDLLLDPEPPPDEVESADSKGDELGPAQRRIGGEQHERSPPLPHLVGHPFDLVRREYPRLGCSMREAGTLAAGLRAIRSSSTATLMHLAHALDVRPPGGTIR